MRKFKLIKWVDPGRYMSNNNKFQYIPNWKYISLKIENIYNWKYIHIYIYSGPVGGSVVVVGGFVICYTDMGLQFSNSPFSPSLKSGVTLVT